MSLQDYRDYYTYMVNDNVEVMHFIALDGQDYKAVRVLVQTTFLTQHGGDWNTLTDADKFLLAVWHVVDDAKLTEGLGLDPNFASRFNSDIIKSKIFYGSQYHHQSVLARTHRKDKTVAYLINMISRSHGQALINYITVTTTLLPQYLNFGFEGTVEDAPYFQAPEVAPEGLFDYVLDRAGTSFANGNGMRAHITDVAIKIAGVTYTDIQTDVYNILSTGSA